MCLKSAGNLVMVLLVAIIGDRLSRVNEFFFALVCGVGTLLLLWGGSQFVYKQDVEKHLSESLVEDSVHIC
jgi:threonine/homoserine/homoserine lactone efflux protein